MGYDIVEDIKKTKVNIYLFELCNFPQQRKKLLESFDPQPNSIPKTIDSDTEINEESIGGKYKSQTFPFLLSFEIFNHNVHNCLVDSGASSNVMSLLICKKINAQPTQPHCQIIQLDKSSVKMIGEMKGVDLVIYRSQSFPIHRYHGGRHTEGLSTYIEQRLVNKTEWLFCN